MALSHRFYFSAREWAKEVNPLLRGLEQKTGYNPKGCRFSLGVAKQCFYESEQKASVKEKHMFGDQVPFTAYLCTSGIQKCYNYVMYFLIFVSIALSLYAIYTVEKSHNSKQRALFYFSLSNMKDTEHQSIGFYVLYISGLRIFIEENSGNLNITPQLYLFKEIDITKQIICESADGGVILHYVSDVDKNISEVEGLFIDMFALKRTSKNERLIEKYLEENGWEIKKALSLKDKSFSKGNFQVYISHVF